MQKFNHKIRENEVKEHHRRARTKNRGGPSNICKHQAYDGMRTKKKNFRPIEDENDESRDTTLRIDEHATHTATMFYADMHERTGSGGEITAPVFALFTP